MARHIVQACPVWIYTQSNIINILFGIVVICLCFLGRVVCGLFGTVVCGLFGIVVCCCGLMLLWFDWNCFLLLWFYWIRFLLLWFDWNHCLSLWFDWNRCLLLLFLTGSCLLINREHFLFPAV